MLAFGALVGLGGLAGGGFVAAKRQMDADALARGGAFGGGAIYTGSILYWPDQGTLCRQLLFDNRTGRLTENGYVDCDSAAYRGPGDVPKQFSTSRLRVISNGFFQH